MYITKEYYRNTYYGVPESDDLTLDRYITRASDKIDIITRYKIKDFNTLSLFIQNAVMKATAAQVEMYVVQGGPENQGDAQSVKIGNFQYTEGGKDNTTRKDVSDDAIDYLRMTGLLYAGLEVVHHEY